MENDNSAGSNRIDSATEISDGSADGGPGGTALTDGGTDRERKRNGDTHTARDPLAPIRENREAVERLAADRDRDDDLDATARILLAAVDGERPDPDDLAAWGLRTGEQYECVAYGPPGGVGQPSRDALRRLSRCVQAVLAPSKPGIADR